MASQSTKKPTKADIIEQLVSEYGKGRSALQRLTLAQLEAALVAAQKERLLDSPPGPAPRLKGDIVVAAEEVVAGDKFGGRKLAEVQVAQKWVYLKDAAGEWFAQFHRGTTIPVTR